jgi:AraC-like DNA-binding protein
MPRSDTVGITDQVRELLAPRVASGSTDMQEIARMLGMSSTTLWRRLGDEGTRFTAVLDQVRHEAALHYLRRANPRVSEIAAALGFRDPRAFIKAFRRWSGTTPMRYRAGNSIAARAARLAAHSHDSGR